MQTPDAAPARLSTRALVHRWAFVVMCCSGGLAISGTWDGRTATWLGGIVYGIGMGRLVLRAD